MMAIPDNEKKFDDTYTCFDTIPAFYGQTVKNGKNSIVLCMLADIDTSV